MCVPASEIIVGAQSLDAELSGSRSDLLYLCLWCSGLAHSCVAPSTLLNGSLSQLLHLQNEDSSVCQSAAVLKECVCMCVCVKRELLYYYSFVYDRFCIVRALKKLTAWFIWSDSYFLDLRGLLFSDAPLLSGLVSLVPSMTSRRRQPRLLSVGKRSALSAWERPCLLSLPHLALPQVLGKPSSSLRSPPEAPPHPRSSLLELPWH